LFQLEVLILKYHFLAVSSKLVHGKRIIYPEGITHDYHEFYLGGKNVYAGGGTEIKSIRLGSECLLIKGNACFHYNSETVGVERLGKYLLKRQHFCFVLYCDMTLSYRSVRAAHNLALSNK
jgi:hypothetical protein